MKTIAALFFAFSTMASHADAQTNATADGTTRSPFMLGHTERLQSAVLGEQRTLNIYLPDGYSAQSDTTYPVIYLLDGAADEDFIHIAGAVQFSSFSWVKRLPPSILVGIANTDRKRDMTFKASADFVLPSAFLAYKNAYKTAGGSENFIAFIEKELQVYIDKNYKTNHNKTLIGQSLAGALATEILLKKPALFDNYIIMSPSLWWDNESLLKQAPALLKSLPSTPMKVYLAVGDEGAEMVNDAKALSEAISKAKGSNLNYHFAYLPQENHGTILHTAVLQAFQLFYEKK